MENLDFSALEEKIGYRFKNKKLLKEALTHSSYANEERRGNNNERMEFLGDSVLSLVVSSYLFGLYRQKHEGDLTKIRASVVCEGALVTINYQVDPTVFWNFCHKADFKNFKITDLE